MNLVFISLMFKNHIFKMYEINGKLRIFLNNATYFHKYLSSNKEIEWLDPGV